VVTLTDPLTAALAEASDETLERVARPWSETEEFWNVANPADLAEFLKEFARARGGDIAVEEAEGARASALARLVSGYESLGSTVGTWLGVRDRGGSPADLARDAAALPRVDAAALNALAPALLPTDDMLLVLVGDAQAVLPQLQSLELPAVRAVDERGRAAEAHR